LERFYVDVLIADASRHGLWRDQEFLDAIVADRKLHEVLVEDSVAAAPHVEYFIC